MKRLMISAMLALAAVGAQAQQDPAEAEATYRVSLEVTRGGRFLGAPLLIMTEGTRQRVTLQDRGTSIRIEPLLQAGADSARLDTLVTIANGSWRPVVTVSFDGQNSFSVEQLSIRVRVEPMGDNAS